MKGNSGGKVELRDFYGGGEINSKTKKLRKKRFYREIFYVARLQFLSLVFLFTDVEQSKTQMYVFGKQMYEFESK